MNMHQFPKILKVTCHTDAVGIGSTFVAIKGRMCDGVQFIPQALEKGAARIVVADDAVVPCCTLKMIEQRDALLLRVADTRLALAQLSAQEYDYPAQSMKFIAITGTKGKTTTAFLLEHMLRTAGYRTALMSTVKNMIVGVDYPTVLTTQQPDYLHAFFALCRERKVQVVVMETAAQAFSMHRVHGLLFDTAIFTNFSQEHGEFYPTLGEYFAAKAKIKQHLRTGAPLLYNADDVRVTQFAQTIPDRIPYTAVHPYDCSQLVGKFNAYNIAAAATCARHWKISESTIAAALKTFTGVPGRLDRYVLPNGAIAFIDKAHNPSSFDAVLGALRSMTKHLIVVTGAGGDREKTKRPIMGDIASKLGDQLVVTSDNPRTEDLASIIEQIVAGVAPENKHKLHVEFDREKAIRLAYQLSSAGSIIAVLGKGPDEYEQVGDVKTPFSEREILKSLK
jgi:UDP-N-acetylmuramoyl-L-alanyl-D-glutamate--2,6-diaminopimelate ligase